MKRNHMSVDFDRIFVDFDGKCGTFLPIKIFLDYTRKSDDFYKTTIVYYKHMFNCSKNRVAKNTELIGGKKIYIRDYNGFSFCVA